MQNDVRILVDAPLNSTPFFSFITTHDQITIKSAYKREAEIAKGRSCSSLLEIILMNINCYVLEWDDAMSRKKKRRTKKERQETSRYKSSKFCPLARSRIILSALKHFRSTVLRLNYKQTCNFKPR